MNSEKTTMTANVAQSHKGAIVCMVALPICYEVDV
jgi:hypothetical protein